MENTDMKSIQQTGIIISLSRDIESEMTRLGAVAAGLHDKTDFLRDRLTPECIKLLHYIASVRNQNAHESVKMSDEDIELFVQSCESVMRELKSLSTGETEIPSDGGIAENIVMSKNGDEFDHEFLLQLNSTWRILAWIPFVNVLYLLGGILKELKNSALYILLILFYFAGIILAGTGLSDGNTFFLWSGIFIFVMVWLYALILRLHDKELKLHKNFCFIPGLHLVYLCYMTWRKTPAVHFIFYAIMAALYFTGAAFLYKDSAGKFGFIMLGISYLGGITDSFFTRIKISKEQ